MQFNSLKTDTKIPVAKNKFIHAANGSALIEDSVLLESMMKLWITCMWLRSSSQLLVVHRQLPSIQRQPYNGFLDGGAHWSPGAVLTSGSRFSKSSTTSAWAFKRSEEASFDERHARSRFLQIICCRTLGEIDLE